MKLNETFFNQANFCFIKVLAKAKKKSAKIIISWLDKLYFICKFIFSLVQKEIHFSKSQNQNLLNHFKYILLLNEDILYTLYKI